MRIFQEVVYDYAIGPIVTAFERIPSFLAAPVINIMLAGVVLAITWQGFEVIRGAGGANPILDVIYKNLRPVFILAFAASFQGYSNFVLPFIKEDLFNLFVGAVTAANNLPLPSSLNPNRLIFEMLDDTLTEQFYLLGSIIALAERLAFAVYYDPNRAWFELFDLPIGLIVENPGIPVVLMCGIIYLVAIVTAVIIALQACFLVVGWNFVLAFGPIFVALYAFPKTEKYADHWLQSVLKYTFGLIVLMILFIIFSSQIIGPLGRLATWYLQPGPSPCYYHVINCYENSRDVGRFAIKALGPIVIGIIAAFIVTKADQMASDLIGGGLTGSGGFAASAGARILGAGRSVVGAAAGAAGLGYAATAGKGHSNPLAQARAGMTQSANEQRAAKNARRENRDKKAYGAEYYPGISLLQRKPKQ